MLLLSRQRTAAIPALCAIAHPIHPTTLHTASPTGSPPFPAPPGLHTAPSGLPPAPATLPPPHWPPPGWSLSAQGEPAGRAGGAVLAAAQAMEQSGGMQRVARPTGFQPRQIRGGSPAETAGTGPLGAWGSRPPPAWCCGACSRRAGRRRAERVDSGGAGGGGGGGSGGGALHP